MTTDTPETVLASAANRLSPIALAESGFLPDIVLRAGIRNLLSARLRELRDGTFEEQRDRIQALVDTLAQGPLAVHTDAANAQHYEIPAEFYALCLGRHRKYSSCLYPTGAETLDEAEQAMLDLTIERARLADGQDILELGCGWGSLSMEIARRFPGSRVTGVSNSASQRESIMERARAEGLHNLEIRTANMIDFDPGATYDRIVSVEMFEHMRNHRELFRRIASWLRPDGLAFAHVFCHKDTPYLFEDEGGDDWMSRHFFTGGMMPSEDLFLHHQDHLRAIRRWRVSGIHYSRTAEHWLENLDRNTALARKVLAESGSKESPALLVRRWRLFFLACAELWGWDDGKEWCVSHILWEKR